MEINGDSGKIVHEVTPDGAVYFGANADPGNTDESSKYPSAVALVWRWTGDEAFLDDLYPASKAAMEFVAGLDEDGDGWPEGLGNVERPGMGEEKLDNAVYTIRGYADLADMAQALGDDETRRWAVGKARALLEKFEETWWYGGDTRSYADSLVDPGNEKVFQRHWIGLTPTDAVLPRLPGRDGGPLASRQHGNATLNEHEEPCYTGDARPVPHRHRPDLRAGRQPGRVAATRWSRQCPASGTSSRSTPRSPRSARATTAGSVLSSSSST